MASDDDKRFLRDRVTEIDREVENYLGNWVVWLIAVIFVLGVLLMPWKSLRAEEHRGHPPQDMAMHQKFYSTWMMPDNRSASCCHDEDCSPAESRFENGHWLARKVGETGEFTPVPPHKVEHDRDSPDGRSHLCGRHYDLTRGNRNLTVFCFIAGGGA
jgi:hypothetical protein